MKQHIIIEKAKRYNASGIIETPEDCNYDAHSGYWVNSNNSIPMMIGSDSRKPTSKKCDIETGEDQKGE